MRGSALSAMVFALLFLVSQSTTARIGAQAAPGVFPDANHPAGAPDPEKEVQIWQVDPLSGQVSISIPFSTTPQGGRGQKIPFKLLYNSGSTVTLQAGGTYSTGLQEVGGGNSNTQPPQYSVTKLLWAPFPESTAIAPTGPWVTSGPYFWSTSSTIGDSGYDPVAQTYSELGCVITGPYQYTDEAGDAHDAMLQNYQPSYAKPAQGAGLNPVCQQAQGDVAWPGSATTDGSGMLTADGAATYPDGTKFTGAIFGQVGYPQHLLEDSNGNTASFTTSGGITTASDAFNREIFSTNIPIGQPGQIPANIYYVDTPKPSSSTPSSYGVTFSKVPVQPFTMPHPSGYQELNCFGSCSTAVGISQTQTGYSFSAITAVSLPNGKSYVFKYHPTYGTISEIDFPTGGYVKFSWAIRPFSWTPYGMFGAVSDIVVTDVYTSTGAGDLNHWSYDLLSQAPSTLPSGNRPQNVYSTVHAPDQTYTTYSYTSRIQPGIPACFSHSIPVLGSLPRFSCKPASTMSYDASGNLMKTEDVLYRSDGLPVQAVTTLYGGTSVQKQTQITYDVWGNVTEKDESDYYSCSGTPCPAASTPPNGWLRKTFASYQYQNQPAWVTAHIVNKPSQTLITDGSGHPYSLAQFGYDETAVSGPTGIVNHDDTNYGVGSSLPRGNLTTESHCQTLNRTLVVTPANAAGACSLWSKTTHVYDLAGQRLATTDADLNKTTFYYTDNYSWGTPSGFTDAYLTSVTYANGLTESFAYDYPSGQVTSHADLNANPTSYTYNDPGNMGRLTQTTYPDTGSVQISYDDAAPPSVTVTTATGQAEGPIVRVSQYDGLGRISHKQLTSDASGTDSVDTAYDSNGRIYSVSNPHRTGSSSSDGTAYYSYDALDRPSIIANQDGKTRQFTYAGNTVTETDENLNKWTRTSNSLGQLVSVLEPNGSSQSPTMETDYAYDPLGDLLHVTQWGGPPNTPGARQRTFT